ncbi:MAG: glucohydrolase, partial [Peptostreptococcus sp.]|nr:glucohydrolase [Peptostreptococcus sp.]
RYLGDKSILIIANFYSEPVDFDLDTYKLEDYRLDLSNYKDMVADGNKISLRPYEAIMLKNY